MTRRPILREAALSLAGALGLAAVVHHASLLHPATTIPNDLGDPLLQTWELAWGGHALLHQPTVLFGANTFWPNTGALAYSDSLLGYAPLSVLGTGPTAALVRYNLLFVVVAALAVWGPYLLARQLGARPAGAMVAGAVCGFAPWRLSQMGHLNILSTGGIALSLALLARGHGVRRGPTRPGLALAGWLVAAWQVTLGFGLGLAFGMLLGLLVLVGVGRWLARGRPLHDRRLVVNDAVGIAAFLGTAALLAQPYLSAVAAHPEARRSLADVAFFSPPLRGLLLAPEVSWVWGDVQAGARSGLDWPPEMCLLPGFVALVLALLGLGATDVGRRAKVALVAAIAVLAAFSLGTHGPFGGRLGFLLLHDHVPGWQGVRTSGRLVALTLIPLSLLAAWGTDLVAHGRRRWVALPLAALVVLEGLGTVPHPVAPPRPAGLDALGRGPAMVLPSDEIGDLAVMWWTTRGFPTVVNGGSGFVPTTTSALREATRGFPDPTSVGALRAVGVHRVAVVLDRIDAAAQERLRTVALPAGVSSAEASGVLLFSLG